MNIGRISTDSEFEKLRQEWNDLYRSCEGGFFLQFDFLFSWWSSYKKQKKNIELCVLALRDDLGVLRGVLPGYVSQESYLGFRVRTLRMLGDAKEAKDLDALIQFEYALEAQSLFGSYFVSTKHFDRASLFFLDPEGFVAKKIVSFLQGKKHVTLKSAGYVIVDLSLGWEVFLSKLRPRKRTEIKKLIRVYEEQRLEFVFEKNFHKNFDLIDPFVHLHQVRWESKKNLGAFGSGYEYRIDFLKKLAGKGLLVVSLLRQLDRIIGYQLYYTDSHTLYLFNEAYDEDFFEQSPGNMLRALTIREFINQKGEFYDFLTGVTFNKESWGGMTRELVHVRISSFGFLSASVRYASSFKRFVKGKWQGLISRINRI